MTKPTKKSIRDAIWKKTNGRCFYCGIPFVADRPRSGVRDWLLPQNIQGMGIDHKLPQRRGGTDDIENLTPCCSACNSQKSRATIDEFRLRIGLQGGVMPHRFACEETLVTERDFLVVVSPDLIRSLILHNYPAARATIYGRPRAAQR